MNDLNRYSDQQFLVNIPLSARYDSNVSLSAKFEAVYWSVNIGKNEFTGHGQFLSEAFYQAIFKAKKGVRIMFNYMLVAGSDGNQRKIQLNNTYTKKRNEKRNFQSLIENGLMGLKVVVDH